jgi:hypothetical protein
VNTPDPKRCYPETLKRLAEPFFAQGETRVFFARCCGWVFVGGQPAGICVRCRKAPTNHECATVEQVVAFADP